MNIERIALLGLAATVLVATPFAFAAEEPAQSPELVPNQVEVAEGILAGGQPSEEQLEALRAAGYRTVLSLRTEGEDGPAGDAVEALGMHFERLPIGGSNALSEGNARRFSELLDSIERPVVIHCGSGNRVGALFALKAFYVDGLDAEAALEVGRQAGMTGLEDAVREHLATADSGS